MSFDGLEGEFYSQLVPLLVRPPTIISQSPTEPRERLVFQDSEPRIVILRSDESHQPVKYENCLVFRNYIHPEHPAENERAIPLPFCSGYSPKPKRMPDRDYLMSFSGFVGGGAARRSMMQSASALRNTFARVYLKETEAFERGLSREEYSNLMSETMLALCPSGGSYETFRLTEALMAGCIPVVVARPTQWYDPVNEAAWISSWSDLGGVLKWLLDTKPSELQERSERCRLHYESHMSPRAVADYINREIRDYTRKKAK